MLKTLPLVAAALFLPGPVLAQNLSTASSPPALVGELLVHSGTFSAQRSVAEKEGGDCSDDETNRREQSSRVWFNPPYLETPQVSVALNSFDFSQQRNARIAARAEDVNPYYMTLVVATWCDTTLHWAGGTFTVMGAIGERF